MRNILKVPNRALINDILEHQQEEVLCSHSEAGATSKGTDRKGLQDVLLCKEGPGGIACSHSYENMYMHALPSPYIHMHVCLSMHSMSLEGFTHKEKHTKKCLPLMGGLEGGKEREGDWLSTVFKHTLAHTTRSFLPHLSVPQPQAATSPFHRVTPLPSALDAAS